MGGEQDGGALLLDLFDQGPEPPPDMRIKPHGGLVQEEDRGVVEQGAGQEQPPFHATRELADRDVRLVLQFRVVQQIPGPQPYFSLGHTVE